jgi:dTDP-4-dehydrorhamnose reductase
MNVLLFGSTGLLGQAMMRELALRGYTIIAAARRGADIAVDISDDTQLIKVLNDQMPDAVINCAALVDVDACEKDHGLAWAANARPLGFIAEWARAHDRPFIHVSTDQYFLQGGNLPHEENAPVTFVNEYARSKFAGECLALTALQALVLRTSIVGIRGWEKPTFAEWAIDLVQHDRPANLFSDAYTSSIDVTTFAKAALDLLESHARGLYNLAAAEVYSKQDFVQEIARQLGLSLSNAKVGSVSSLTTRRANCLGLDVSKATQVLGYALPSLPQVVASILNQYSKTYQG